MILERARLVGWRSGNSRLRTEIQFPVKQHPLSNFPVGRATWESEEWLVSFYAVVPMELVIVSKSGETLVEATLRFWTPKKSRLKYRGRVLELSPIDARSALLMDGKPVLIRWEAWKDRDVHRDVTHFMWVDTNGLGAGWPALATADELLLRIETARDSSWINEPTQ